MDFFAHGLWTNAVFYKNYPRDRKNRWTAILFGVLPDAVSFTPAMIYLVFHRMDFYSLAVELGKRP